MLMREITNDPFALQYKAKSEAIKQQRTRLRVQQAQLTADKARQRANWRRIKIGVV